MDSKVVFEIPWALIEPHRAQAMKFHGQTLERLAERGGLSPQEAVAVLDDKDFWDRWPEPQLRDVRQKEAEQILLRMIEGWPKVSA